MEEKIKEVKMKDTMPLNDDRFGILTQRPINPKDDNEHTDYLVTKGKKCAWIRIADGVITDAAPIFRKYIGKRAEKMTVDKIEKLLPAYQDPHTAGNKEEGNNG